MTVAETTNPRRPALILLNVAELAKLRAVLGDAPAKLRARARAILPLIAEVRQAGQPPRYLIELTAKQGRALIDVLTAHCRERPRDGTARRYLDLLATELAVY